MKARKLNNVLILLILLLGNLGFAQEETPFVSYEVPSQNLLKFNRYLINPTFSTVREDKSYISLFHRNQSVSFDDNNQTYFLSYSGRIGDRSGMGLSFFTQREGLIDNFGVLANYAYGIKLSDKSNFTFGANFSYYNSGFNEGRANPLELDDPALTGLDDSALISFQPGFNISYDKFDFGIFAENLFDYNLKTSESVTDFNEKTFTGHLQYTHEFDNASGIFEGGRMMPLARVRKPGEDNIVLGGNLILDLPKLGWLQAGYDDFYGASAGIGFNLTKRISLGYTVEKGLSDNFQNFGANHEISLAYSFAPTLTEDRVMLEKATQEEVVAKEAPVEELSLTKKDSLIAELQTKLAENDAILEELLFRQDSIERYRKQDLERRFTTVMRMVRRETKGENPQLEQRARELYFSNMDSLDRRLSQSKTPLANHGVSNSTATKKLITLNADNYVVNEEKAKEEKGENLLIKKDKVASRQSGMNTKKTGDGLRNFNIPNVESGYYLVANVYKGSKYMQSFMDRLETEGLNPKYIENPRNGYKYVYLKKFGSKAEAFDAYKSKLDGSYTDEVWVMKVTGNDHERIIGAAAKSSYDDYTLQKNVVNKPLGTNDFLKHKSSKGNGLASGFYLVADVFNNSKKAKEFVKDLNAQGLNASYFVNPTDNQKYVYLKRHQTWNNALDAYYSKLNDTYGGDLRILRI